MLHYTTIMLHYKTFLQTVFFKFVIVLFIGKLFFKKSRKLIVKKIKMGRFYFNLENVFAAKNGIGTTLLFAFIDTFFLGSNGFDQKALHLKEYDIQNHNDVTPVVIQALKKCKAEGFSKIEFPKDTYHFYPTFAPEYYCEITNNDNGLKRTLLPLIGFHDFMVDGTTN
jgi:hypothetical protein